MAISIKSQQEIEYMREAGRLLALVHQTMAQEIRPGMSTHQIDKIGIHLRNLALKLGTFFLHCPGIILPHVNFFRTLLNHFTEITFLISQN